MLVSFASSLSTENSIGKIFLQYLDDIEREFNRELRSSLAEHLGEILTNAIIEGKIGGGEKLVENKIQKKLNISRSPIREAFRTMERNKLVVNIPRKGTYVRTIGEKDIQENFPIRAYLEGLAAELAVPNLKANDLAGMESDLAVISESARLRDYKTCLKYHSKFHESFIHASKNTTLVEILESLRRQSIWFRLTYFYVLDSSEVAVAAHSEILELFKRKDAERVNLKVRNHILLALEGFLDFINTGRNRFRETVNRGENFPREPANFSDWLRKV